MTQAPTTAPRVRLFVRPTWDGPAGIREIAAVMLPLIVSNSLNSINLFLDRTFLAWYGEREFAAALQGGMTYWLCFSFFFAIVTYANTFVAQMHGAGIPRQIGAVIWQAIHLSVVAGGIFAALSPLGWPFFRWVGHEGNLPALEAEYFQILALGSIAGFLMNALYCFYAGRGKTGLVLFITLCVCLTNTALNGLFIFKPFWIIPTGIAGAAIATVLSQFVGVALYLAFMLARRGEYEREYALFSSWRFNPLLVQRVVRFALPAGVHQTLEVAGFTVFMLVTGVFGFEAQHASNMAMNINLLLFIPAVGLHIAVSILAGQYCGARDHAATERLTSTAALICSVYMLGVIFIYTLFPDPLIHVFRGGMEEEKWLRLEAMAKFLLFFVAFYSFFDGLFLVYSGVLKGAGDTRYVMFITMFFAILVLAIPCLIIASYAEALGPRVGLYLAWGLCAAQVVMLALANLMRFRGGQWRNINMVG